MSIRVYTAPDGRLNELLLLQARVEAEIAAEQKRLAEAARKARQKARVRRSRFEKPPCGTEQGYQWHRHREGRVTCVECRAGHSRYVVAQRREQRWLRGVA